MRESTAAADLLARAVIGYQAYEEAEIELKDLRARQTEQRRLEKEMADAQKKKAEFDGKADAARLQAEALASQKREIEAERAVISERVDALRSGLAGSEPEFERQKWAADSVTRDLSEVRHFVQSFGNLLAHEVTTLQKIKEVTADLSAWDASSLQNASRQETNADETLQHARQQFAAAHAEHSSLSTQLEEIRGGICPFLKEMCRQFDPSKVEGDLRQKIATIASLRKKIESAQAALCEAKIRREHLQREERNLAGKSSQLELMAADFSSDFDRLGWDALHTAVNGLRQWIPNVQPMPDFPETVVEGADPMILEGRHRQNIVYLTGFKDWCRAIENGVQSRIGVFREEDRRRNADQQNEVNGTDQLRRIESEISKLGAAEYKQRDDAAIYEALSAELVKSIASLDQRLEAFGLSSR